MLLQRKLLFFCIPLKYWVFAVLFLYENRVDIYYRFGNTNSIAHYRFFRVVQTELQFMI